jgi:Ca2+-binding RTX toxin-like protein
MHEAMRAGTHKHCMGGLVMADTKAESGKDHILVPGKRDIGDPLELADTAGTGVFSATISADYTGSGYVVQARTINPATGVLGTEVTLHIDSQIVTSVDAEALGNGNIAMAYAVNGSGSITSAVSPLVYLAEFTSAGTVAASTSFAGYQGGQVSIAPSFGSAIAVAVEDPNSAAVRLAFFNSGITQPPTYVTTSGDDVELVALQDGNYALIHTQAGGTELAIQQYDNAGNAVESEFIISTDANGISDIQAVTMEDGRISVTWAAGSSANLQGEIVDVRDTASGIFYTPDTYFFGTDNNITSEDAQFVFTGDGFDNLVENASSLTNRYFDLGADADFFTIVAASSAGNTYIGGDGAGDQIFFNGGAPTNGHIGWTIDLNNGTAVDGTGLGQHTLIGFENVSATGVGDVVTDSSAGNVIFAGSGDDRVIVGNGGSDQVFGGNNTDTLVFNSNVAYVDLDANITGSGQLINLLSGTASVQFSQFENFELTDGDDTFIGDGVANMITGGKGLDELHGGGGDDTLIGNGGVDMLYGEDGHDTLNGGYGADLLEGGLGNDTIYGGNGNDIITGGDNDDFLYGDLHNDTINGAAGADQAFGGAGGDTIHGGIGNDILRGQGGRDIIYGQDNDDILTGDYGHDELRGGDGNDELSGGQGNDEMYGGLGDDTIYGDLGLDLMYGNDGEDEMFGGGGQDILYGGNDNDILRGGGANDTLYGESADDQLFGEDGADILDGGGGDDLLSGGLAADILHGGTGNDTLNGGSGVDLLNGGANNDVLRGGGGNDTLNGDDHADQLFGDDGGDILNGGAGADKLNGGTGFDVLTGGTGSDQFIFSGASFDNDRITDFEDGTDLIVFRANTGVNSMADFIDIRQAGADVVIETAAGNVRIEHTDLSDIDASDFSFG